MDYDYQKWKILHDVRAGEAPPGPHTPLIVPYPDDISQSAKQRLDSIHAHQYPVLFRLLFTKGTSTIILVVFSYHYYHAFALKLDIKPGPKLDETFERAFIREIRMTNEEVFDDESKAHRFTRYTLEDVIEKFDPHLDPLK